MLLILTTIIVVVQAQDIEKFCDLTNFDPVHQNCYTKEILLTLTHNPNQLAFDKNTNTLYFSFDASEGEYNAALYKMKTKKLTVLKGIKDAFAMATDDNGKEIYFGGTHGIYKYNSSSKILKRLNMNHLDVWWLFVKTDIYFIKFPSLNTYYYRNGSIKTLQALKDQNVHQLVLDRDNHIFFTNHTGLYGLKFNGKPQLIQDNARFINMALDNNGYVYVSTEEGIYTISKMVQNVRKIVSIQGVLGFTFDNENNLIYSNSHELVRLVPILQPLH